MIQDEPYSLRHPEEIHRRRSMLDKPHIKPLFDYLEAIRQQHPEQELPCFDPCDGGIQARALFLLEAPGPKAVGSTFISRNNPDQSAKNMNGLFKDAAIARKDTIIWNIVPWYVGDGKRIRPVDDRDIRQATPYLRDLLALLPNLKVIVLMGKKAQLLKPHIQELTSLPILETYHCSPRVFNSMPTCKEHVKATFARVPSSLK